MMEETRQKGLKGIVEELCGCDVNLSRTRTTVVVADARN